MFSHTVHSQLIRIGQTGFTHSALKRYKHHFIKPILVSQHSIHSPKKPFIDPQLYNGLDANKPQSRVLGTKIQSKKRRVLREISPTERDATPIPSFLALLPSI